jgi:hypothetical protein
LTVSISPSGSFKLNSQNESNITVTSIGGGITKPNAFSVKPNGGLAVGVHIATITVTGANNIFAVFTVSFTVKPPTITVTDPSQVTWDVGINEVTYTGTGALTGENNTDFVVPSGKTLIITGEITNQAKKITTTSGTITNDGTITTANTGITAAVLANLVGIQTTSNGKVVLTGAVPDVAAPLALGADLEIGGSITYTGGTAAFSGDKAVTIAEGGALNLGGTGLGTANIDNKGTITTTTANLTTLQNILAVGGNITASGGNINVTSDTTIKADSTLTIANTGKLTIASTATLKVAGTLALTGTDTLDNIYGGTIEVTTAATLAEVLELNGLNGKVTVNKTDVTLRSDAIVPSGVELLVPSGQTLRVSEVTLTVNGKLTVNGTLTGDGNLVVEDGSVVVGKNGDVTVTGSNSSGLIDVTAKYELNKTDNNTTNGIEIDHATRDADGVDTIYLKGTNVTDDSEFIATWYGTKSGATTGNYAIATIKGLFNGDVLANGRTLKNTNESWSWYNGYKHSQDANISDTPMQEASAGDSHIWPGNNETPAYVWKKTVGPITDDELTVILWSGATNKQATLEIVPLNADKSTLNDAAKYTVIVNWDGLNIK